MGARFILTLLSADGYQVFAALHGEFATLEAAIAGAEADYRARYGGSPAFRVYHSVGPDERSRHTLIEACFDPSKRRSFVALYKVYRDAGPIPARRPSAWENALAACAAVGRRIGRWLTHHEVGERRPWPAFATS